MALITDHIDEDTSVSEIEETVSFSNEQLLNRIKHLESENKGLLDLNAQQEQDLQNVRDKLESKEDTAVIKNLKKTTKRQRRGNSRPRRLTSASPETEAKSAGLLRGAAPQGENGQHLRPDLRRTV